MYKRALCLIFTLSLLIAHTARAEELKTRYTDDYFSTVSALMLYTQDAAAYETAWARVKELLAQIDDAVSMSKPQSDIARFNALKSGQSCSVSNITAEILLTALDVYHQTNGLYDPTVYPLVDLWGFSPRFNTNMYQPTLPYDRAYEDGHLPLPDARYIQGLLPLVGLDGVTMSGDPETGWTLTKSTAAVVVDGQVFQAQMDLGGIAKGYACDRVTALLTEMGFAQGHFVCGGSSIAVLARPSGLYGLTLGKPRAGQSELKHYATVYMQNTTLSTSSDASHTYLRNGVIYCHIIDPRTGYPINMPTDGAAQEGIACVTLLSPGAARNDALSTALCIMGSEEAMAYVATRMDGVAAVMVLYRTGEPYQEVYTNLTDEAYVLEDAAYRLACAPQGDGEIVYTGTLFAE